MLKELWHDDRGSVMAVEWLFVASILLVGAVAGLSALCDRVDPEVRSLMGQTAASSSAGMARPRR